MKKYEDKSMSMNLSQADFPEFQLMELEERLEMIAVTTDEIKLPSWPGCCGNTGHGAI